MSETETSPTETSLTEAEGLLEQIDRRVAALAAAEKQLKKPSTISFVERRDLGGKAARAAAELRAQRGETEANTETDQEPTEALSAALAEADRVLDRIAGAQPAGFNRGSGAGASSLPGQQRRGTAGRSQTRPPDRVGE